ncbi:hypothetical protein V2A60_002218 [Cordyceps javanica]|uniref:Uncharacterized protein n=1 Tax=Cordyceps javanica TaxID=43265 RepID=A0A545VHM2_9HYPO|nr:hypothetical protein IF1G_01142 [Cordyceps javanica]TQW12364.1 hypothetical protein IF2G_01095 [Cordyceps javanica]
MQYNVLAVALFACAASASFVDQNVYASEIAPAMLQHLAGYRAGGGPGLSSAQSSFLDDAESVVKNLNVEKLEGLKDACNAAFGSEECTNILHPGGQVKSGLGKRDDCQCSTKDSWCDNNTRCSGGAGGCSKVGGCGTLYRYECDGECVN